MEELDDLVLRREPITGNFLRQKSYSLIAMNLETVEDVDAAIRQLQAIRERLASGLNAAFDSDVTIKGRLNQP